MDLGWDGSGQGGMDGLMKGQMVVEWEIDRQTAKVILRQPKNTPCCGVRCLVLPSKDIGSIGPPGLRIWLKIACDRCRNGSRRRLVQARRLLRDSRRARVSCEGKWCK